MKKFKVYRFPVRVPEPEDELELEEEFEDSDLDPLREFFEFFVTGFDAGFISAILITLGLPSFSS